MFIGHTCKHDKTVRAVTFRLFGKTARRMFNTLNRLPSDAIVTFDAKKSDIEGENGWFIIEGSIKTKRRKL